MSKNFIVIFCFALIPFSIYGKDCIIQEIKLTFLNLAEGIYYHNVILKRLCTF